MIGCYWWGVKLCKIPKIATRDISTTGLPVEPYLNAKYHAVKYAAIYFAVIVLKKIGFLPRYFSRSFVSIRTNKEVNDAKRKYLRLLILKGLC